MIRLWSSVACVLVLAAAPARADLDAPTDMKPVEERIKQLLAEASNTAQSWTKKVPGEVVDAKPALGGAYIVLKFKDMAKLAVFSIVENKIVEYIKLLDTESLFAAGGTKLVVFSPDRRLIQTYDLLTFKRIKSKSFRGDEKLLSFEMGLHNDHAAAVLYSGEGRSSRPSFALFDLAAGRLVMPERKKRSYMSLYGKSQLRADGRLELLTYWSPGVSPQGVGFLLREGKEITNERDHDTAGHLAPTLEGRWVFSGRGHIYRSSPNRIIKREGAPTWPVLGSPFYLTIKADQRRRTTTPSRFLIKDRESLQLIKELGEAPKLASRSRGGLALDRKVFAIAAIDCMVHIDVASRTLRTARLNLPAATARASDSRPEPATRGQLWSHKLPFNAGTAVVVEDAPEGIRFDKAKMSLSWKVPRSIDPGLHEILISLIPPGGEERYDRVYVEVR